jgi:hypothetical protein
MVSQFTAARNFVQVEAMRLRKKKRRPSEMAGACCRVEEVELR